MEKFLRITVTIFLFFLSFMLTIFVYFIINRNNDVVERELKKYFPPVSSVTIDNNIEVFYE